MLNFFKFGDEYRPCKLTRHVVSIPRKNGQNDFQFNKILDLNLYGVIQKFTAGKPVLVFCSTRKGSPPRYKIFIKLILSRCLWNRGTTRKGIHWQ